MKRAFILGGGLLTLAGLTTVLAASLPLRDATRDAAATPPELVAAYSSLADTILAAKRTEWEMVHAILAATYGHAEATVARVRGKLDAGQSAKDDIELLAALVAQLGNEGDAAVAGIRKRLIEGGHHHHASGENEGVYDEGFVVVTREAKRSLLEAAGRIGRLGNATDGAALAREWKSVTAVFGALHEDAHR